MIRTTKNIIEPHGGELVNRILDQKKARLYTNDRHIKRMTVADDYILDIEKIAIGAYSPLKGFMCQEDFSEVVHNMRMADGTPWTIPIFLPVGNDLAGSLSKREKIIIRDCRGADIAVLTVKEIFSYNKRLWAQKVYGTDSNAHPGVKRVYDAHEKFLGGDISLIRRPSFKFEKHNLDPVKTRSLIQKMGWKSVSGFQTRNIPHRAHEYLQKIALSFTDGILIHPIIGWKKDGDFLPDVIIKAYGVLIKKYFPKNRVIFAGLATAMRYAGPREAVFHAIIRKNYGCTHFIVGRDHAGVGDYYGKYDAHRIFDRLPDLGIKPLLLREPYYCKRCKEIVSDKICPHSRHWHKYISGTMIRKIILKKDHIPGYLIRPEVFQAMKRCQKRGKELCI